MKNWPKRVLASALMLLLAPVVSAPAEVLKFNATITWGGSSAAGTDADKLWSAYLPNPVAASVANSTRFNELGSGFNGRNYYNPDEANSASCAPLNAYGYKYGCINLNTFNKSPIAPTNPGPAATASGPITVTTDPGAATVAITGVLAVVPYDYRLADGSPFGNVWYGVTGGSLILDLTGTIVGTDWVINGGTAVFSNPDPDGAGPLQGFQCSTLNNGVNGLTCIVNLPGMPGDYQSDGGQLSFLPLPIYSDTAGCSGVNTCAESPLSTVSGVLATLAVDQNGDLVTTWGEYRRGLASSAAAGNIYWNPATQQFINNSTFYVGPLAIQGAAVIVPQANDDVASVLEGSVNNTIGVLANDIGFAVPAVVTITTAPNQGGTATVNPDNTLNYAPAAGFTGTETLGYTATSGADADTALLTITVEPDVTPNPTANDDALTVLQGRTNVTIPVLANDTGFTGSVVVTITTAPNQGGTATVNPDNTLNYSPANGFAGTETLGYTATAGTDLDAATVTVSVEANSSPVAPAGTITSINTVGFAPNTRSGSVSVAALAGYAGGNPPSAVTVTTPPARGTTLISGTTIGFTPAANFFSGTDGFSYTLADADGETATNTVTVTIPDAQPTISDLTLVTDQGNAVASPASFTLGNGSRAQHSLTVQSGGASGTCTISGDLVTYTPQADFFGDDSCSIQFADGDGSTDGASVEVFVNEGVDPNFRPGISAMDPGSLGFLVAVLMLGRRRMVGPPGLEPGTKRL